MKKLMNLGLILILVLSLLAGCAGNETAEEPASNEQENQETNSTEQTNDGSEYKDGIYFAQEDKFNPESGWKYMVTLEVKDGKIVSADWNGANINAGIDKKTTSKEGKYQMVEKGGAQAPWYEQAEKAEAFLIDTQDPTAIEYKDDEGHTDAISGVSIHVKEFFTLAKEALENGPVGKGQYKDGAYHAEEDSFDENSGWKYTVDLTVINGNIVAANWNGVHKDGGDDKNTQSMNGEYVMKEGGTPWHEQAMAAEEFLIDSQDPTAIQYSDDEGHTDAISGVSIHVKEFFELAQKALADAK
ncbi:FMN-binding protein [Maledivibacter halophilus]|uniref:Major membrane immunogen, membrane-anchored lipoprotein n=1 Tax=Maledivibacter halophilus TaxID=36842 RepID=A0A1T5IQZ6_9FIRM|nr:FMN-binding protein [Maledivibacter halophilus]SKC41571.1 Major membrane immunogen, membrane-anchored lipoprotein [Maledivibacter halophilus]